jgi:hypothetical protein
MGKASCSLNGGEEKYIEHIHWKPIRKRALVRPRRKWVDNIKMDLREIGWGGMDWIDLAQVRDKWKTPVNEVMNLQVLYNSGKFLSRCITGGFFKRGSAP